MPTYANTWAPSRARLGENEHTSLFWSQDPTCRASVLRAECGSEAGTTGTLIPAQCLSHHGWSHSAEQPWEASGASTCCVRAPQSAESLFWAGAEERISNTTIQKHLGLFSPTNVTDFQAELWGLMAAQFGIWAFKVSYGKVAQCLHDSH